MGVWDDSVDAAVAASTEALHAAFPGSRVSIREVIDDRGVVALLVTAGDGRLVVAARSVDLMPVAWPWRDGIETTTGRLPSINVLTVDEVIAGLVEA